MDTKENKNQKKKMEKKQNVNVILIAIILFIIILFNLFGSTALNKIRSEDVITSTRLEKAIDISELSTAEFVYNGIAEKYKDTKSKKIECYISYNANVKVGIQMKDVKFNIDKEGKTITPILPTITVNIVTLDEKSLSYIPQDPDVALKEVISICKEDAMNEANESEKLYEAAEANLKAVIEALLSPIIDNTDYTIVW